jgi:hypothetical protein
MKTLRYQIKALRTLKSGAYTASLYCDGKKVADVEDEGRGGSPRVYYADGKAYGEGYEALTTWFEATCPEWHWSHEFIAGGQIEELAIAFLIDVAEWNRLAKKGNVLVFRKPGCSDIEHYVAEETYTQPVKVGLVGAQIAAARLEGLQVWEYGEQRWVA